MRRNGWMLLCCVLTAGVLSSCATTETIKKPYRFSPQGTVIWNDEYEFKPPPLGWKLIQVESGGEFSFGFLRMEPGPFPSQSMFVYDEEPFGWSLKFEKREEEFFKRFLWASAINVRIRILTREKVNVAGGEGLAVIAEGEDPVKKEKAKAKVVFAKRGERVVAFYLTQCRHIDSPYDPSAFEVFDQFVASFKFLRKSFFENL